MADHRGIEVVVTLAGDGPESSPVPRTHRTTGGAAPARCHLLRRTPE